MEKRGEIPKNRSFGGIKKPPNAENKRGFNQENRGKNYNTFSSSFSCSISIHPQNKATSNAMGINAAAISK